ncbi:hypothetical protein [Nonomuraea candida]|uniref:hypothetical protein n=1 Tax=Nonomuraea candida TaxID=359159 RepID=UPI0012F7B8F1|nr:hypothetical protein [Nonomuraea candida]
MRTHPTCVSGTLFCDPVKREAAEEQADTLRRVIPHLQTRGVREQLIMGPGLGRCAITVYGTNEDLWHQPEMTIHADAGWLVATVTIGERSGSYLVELARVGPGNEPAGTRTELVPSSRPYVVASLVVAHACARVAV